jgi:hypothetical protein
MTTTRTPIARVRKARLASPEVLDAYRRARKLYDTSKIDEWGCLSDQCRAARNELHELLGRTCCDVDILDTIDCNRVWNETAAEFAMAVEIRQELERRCLVT